MQQSVSSRKRKQAPTDIERPSTAISGIESPTTSVHPGATNEKRQLLDNGKRRVRKGTKSCWQCRRRKIKCEYRKSGDSVCIRCTEKGDSCRSQEYPEHPGPDEKPEAQPPVSTKSVHQRLSEMEKALQVVMCAVGPSADIFSQKLSDSLPYQASIDFGSADEDGEDYVDGEDDGLDVDTGSVSVNQAAPPPKTRQAPEPTQGNTASNPHRNVLDWRCNIPTPPETDSLRLFATPHVLPRSQKLDMLRTKLLPLFPPQEDIDRIFENSSGVYFVLAMTFSVQSLTGPRVPPVKHIRTLPSATAHPLCMALKLLQLAVIIQHLEPAFDRNELSISKPLNQLTDEWYGAVSMMVTNDDDLTGTLEGIECLLIQCLYMANLGSLRKAWILCRRAIGFAQLMGLGQGIRSMVPSVDDQTDAAWKPSPAYLWYRLNFFDRYTSMLLGLPCATQDESFATPEALALLDETDKLERILTVASAKITERNTMRPANARDVTMRIYQQVREAANSIPTEWWVPPSLVSKPITADTLSTCFQVMVQMHYFSIMIILHLPYMMKGATVEQREFSKSCCLSSSREVLTRFGEMRRSAMSSVSCRHIDYTALVGSMTLLLSYLDHNGPGEVSEPSDSTSHVTTHQRSMDRSLVASTQKLLDDMARKTSDRLTAEAACIVQQLFPIIETGLSSSTKGLCRINVPYLGTVTLRTRKPSREVSGEPTCQVPTSMSEYSTIDRMKNGHPTNLGLPDPDPPQPLNMNLHPEDSNLNNQSMPPLEAIGDLFTLDPTFQQFDFRGFEGHQFSSNPTLPPTSDTIPMNLLGAPEPSLSMYEDHGLGGATGEDFGGPTLSRERQPSMAADAGRWAFQGVDTNYWTLLGQPFNEELIRLMHEPKDS